MLAHKILIASQQDHWEKRERQRDAECNLRIDDHILEILLIEVNQETDDQNGNQRDESG